MATALELTREEWEPYIQGMARRTAPAGPSPHKQQERQALLRRVRQAAEQLKQQFGVSRVILFGSLAHTAWFVDDSDVDLAVDGLAPADYWKAWQLVEAVVEVRPVDLVDYQTASDSLRAAIDRSGIEL